MQRSEQKSAPMQLCARPRTKKKRQRAFSGAPLAAGLSPTQFLVPYLLLLLNLAAFSGLLSAQDNSKSANSSLPHGEISSQQRRRAVTNSDEPLLATSIRLNRFQVPSQVRQGDFRRLTCLYDIQGATLHAVKLFKDNKEFYRYMPTDQKLAFQVAGIKLDLRRSNSKDVWLQIDRRSSGVYRCQVSVEGTFNSVSAERRMDVVDAASQQQQTAGGSGRSAAPVADSAWPHAGTSARSKLQAHASQNAARTQQAQQTVRQQTSQMYAFSAPSAACSAINIDNNLLCRRVATHLLITSAILFLLHLRRPAGGAGS